MADHDQVALAVLGAEGKMRRGIPNFPSYPRIRGDWKPKRRKRLVRERKDRDVPDAGKEALFNEFFQENRS